MPSVHIYRLSKLVHAQPRSWVQLLTTIEEGKRYAFRHYLPMREAVARICASRGAGRDEIVAEMTARARLMPGARPAAIAKDNLRAFETFEAAFLPKIARLRRSLLREKQHQCDFEGVNLQGAPHLEVMDGTGNRRYVFLHAAKWPKQDLTAYLELLNLVVAKAYGGKPDNLWVMDLRAGREVKWRPKPRELKRCKDAARLYAKLVSAIGNQHATVK